MKRTVRIVFAGLAALVLLIEAAPVVHPMADQHKVQISDIDHPTGG